MYVHKGLLIVPINAVTQARPLMRYDDFVVDADLEYQVYDEDSGATITRSFSGKGQVVDRGSHRAILLGDPYRHATLWEYRIDDKPTASSEAQLGRIVAGVKAALGDFKIGRRMSAKGEDWLRGYDEALKQRKSRDP